MNDFVVLISMFLVLFGFLYFVINKDMKGKRKISLFVFFCIIELLIFIFSLLCKQKVLIAFISYPLLSSIFQLFKDLKIKQIYLSIINIIAGIIILLINILLIFN